RLRLSRARLLSPKIELPAQADSHSVREVVTWISHKGITLVRYFRRLRVTQAQVSPQIRQVLGLFVLYLRLASQHPRACLIHLWPVYTSHRLIISERR